ncbi:MAG TPA: DUF2339 domain-containing protein [Thermoleophilaceae bacterium]|nr:DUF2339 domain-containing protein [Thermoleophilaceae bacterium]
MSTGGVTERERIEQLQQQMTELHRRVRALERRDRSEERAARPRLLPGQLESQRDAQPGERTASQPAAEPPAAPLPPVPVWGTLSLSAVSDRLGSPDRESVEDVLGGRVLAWVGGLAVLLGIAFLFAMAASRGWIGESARVALAGLASTALLVVGVWLHERKGRTDAALAAVATGVSAMFVTITVAAQVYEVIPDLVAIVMAIAAGSVATALAVRWESRGIGALGILGALVAPVLAGAEPEAGSVAILFVALASAAGVLLWQRWDWLALAAFAVSVPQWGFFLFDGADAAAALITLVAFGGLGIVLAVGHEIRAAASSIRTSSAFLLALNALTVAGIGWLTLHVMGEPSIAKLWLAGVAAMHVALGLTAPRVARVSHDLGLLSLVIGVILANVAFGLLADGVVLTAGWAASAVGFAALARRSDGRLRGAALGHSTRDAALVQAGLGGHVALALLHTLTVDAPVSEIAEGAPLSAAGAASIVVLAAACLISGRLAGRELVAWRVVLDALGLAALAYLTGLSLEGPALAFAWTAESAALLALAHRIRDHVAGWACLGFLSLAAVCVAAVVVPPDSLGVGAIPSLPSLGTLGAFAAAALAAGRLLPAWLGEGSSSALRLVLDNAGLTACLYLTVLLLDGPALTAALAGEALVLALVSSRYRDEPAAAAALVVLGAAVVHAIAMSAPPVSLVTGLAHPLDATVALGAVAAAAILAASALSTFHPRARPALLGAAGVVVLYLASGLVVTPFESGEAVDSALLSAHQQGQMVLSVFWALVGVAVLVTGLQRDLHALRIAGLALLGVTVAKVFLFDLATLSSMYRVVSLIGLGLLLLAGAFVWQRLRPRALRDLREVPEGIR